MQQDIGKKKAITFFIQSWSGGGIEKVTEQIICNMDSSLFDISLVLAMDDDYSLELAKSSIPVFMLKASKPILSLFRFIKWVKHYKPNIVVSASYPLNIVAIIAQKLSGIKYKLIIVEHINVTIATRASKKPISRLPYLLLIKLLYSKADYIVAVSKGVSDDLQAITGLSKDNIAVIYNPVITDKIYEMSRESVEHPWLVEDNVPVFLAVGRMVEQKDYPTLLKAFSLILNSGIKAKLIILGDGPLKQQLKELANELGLKNDVDFPGFDANPYRWMKAANCLVLSSLWEGLPTVIVEAMAIGLPVVATDCPSGPSELIEDGVTGRIVPIGCPEQLAHAMVDIINQPPKSILMSEKAKKQIVAFTAEVAVSNYLKLFN